MSGFSFWALNSFLPMFFKWFGIVIAMVIRFRLRGRKFFPLAVSSKISIFTEIRMESFSWPLVAAWLIARFGQLGQGNVFLDQLTDSFNVAHLVGQGERNCFARLAGPAGSSDAMDIIVQVVRQIIV